METLASAAQSIYVYDLEAYPNYFLALFKRLGTDDYDTFVIEDTASQADNEQTVIGLFHLVTQPNTWLIGYNSFRFDDTILRYIFRKQVCHAERIFKFVTTLINNSPEDRKTINRYRYDTVVSWRCVDLQELKPGTISGKTREWSLKKHQGRLRWHRLQELPIKPGTVLSEDEKNTTADYCRNDVVFTEALYNDYLSLGVIHARADVAEQYPDTVGYGAYKMSEPVLASTIIEGEYFKRTHKNKRDIARSNNYFYPDKYILDSISFQDKENQEALAYLRSAGTCECRPLPEREKRNPPQNHIAWHLKRVNFKFGDYVYSLGLGGIHTNFRGKVVKSNLVEFDVTSFYPNLIQMFNRTPGRTSQAWLDIFVGMKEQREALKKSGDPSDKRLANVYKIVINSVYGKFRQETDLSYDPSLATQVVINGQLAICMLCERFTKAEVPVVFANTDGVLVDVGEDQYAIAAQVARAWEDQFNGAKPARPIRLEESHFACVIAESINDYVAADNEGKIKRKGDFANTSQMLPTIIREAIVEKVCHDIPIKTTVRARTDVFDFAFISAIDSHHADEVLWGDSPTQFRNRVYYSTDGQLLRRFKGAVEKDPPKGVGRVRLLNKVQSTQAASHPTIDYDRYIEEAQALLDKIERGACGEDNEVFSSAKKAAEKYPELTVVPKGSALHSKQAYQHFMAPSVKSIPLENHPWEAFNGFGAVTGPEFGILAIDIDHPDIAKQDGLYDVLFRTKAAARNCLICHHAKKIDDVRDGKGKGTVAFRYSGHDLKTVRNSRFNQAHGYEVLYGDAIVQMAGIHEGGTRYTYSGKIVELPERLLQKILRDIDTLSALPESAITQQEYPTSKVDRTFALELLLAVQKAAEALGGPSKSLTLGEHNGVPQLKGRCPYDHGDNPSDHFFVHVKDEGQLATHCFHQKCFTRRSEWLREIKEDAVAKPSEAHDPYQPERIADVREFFDDSAEHKLLIGPTGIGKTYGLAARIAKTLTETDDKMAVVVSSTAEQQTLGSYLHLMLCGEPDADNRFAQYGIAIVETGNKVKVGPNYKSKPEIPKNARIAILNKTHIATKGFSTNYFSYLKWVEKHRPHFVIDEVDNVISNSWCTTTNLGGNVLGQPDRGGRFTLSCPWREGNGTCLTCYQVKYEGFVKYNPYNIPEWTYDAEPHPSKHVDEHPHIILSAREIGKAELTGIEVSSLEMGPDPTPIVPGGTEHPNPQQVFDHKIGNSYFPTLYKHFPTIDGNRASSEEIVDRFRSADGKSLETPDNVVLRPPTRACKALFVTTLDRAPLRFVLEHARSLTMMTATLPPSHKGFLTSMVPDLKIKEVAALETRIMDKIILIGLEDKLDKHMAPVLSGAVRPIIFERTRQYASYLYQKLLEDYKGKRINNPHLWDQDRKVARGDGRAQAESPDAVVTYSHGVYGRGVNLGTFKEIWVNDNAQKPTCLYPTNDAEKLAGMIDADKYALIQQNIGRVLRREEGETEAFRLAVVYRMQNEKTLECYAEKLGEMSRTSIETVYIPGWARVEHITECFDYVRKNKSLPELLPFSIGYLIRRAKEMGEGGKSFTDLGKEILHRVGPYESDKVCQSIVEAYYEGCELAEGRVTTEKEARRAEEKLEAWTSKRLKTLTGHVEKHNPLGVIKRDMRYQEFTDAQKHWFDEAYRELLSKAAP